MTRARDFLFISHYSHPSRFLEDIPPALRELRKARRASRQLPLFD